MSARIDVSENILTWAINRAGFELAEFLVYFPKVNQWINIEKKPTLNTLK